MNFEEALTLKTKIGDTFTIYGQTIGKVLVTPKIDNDFTIYMENYWLNNFDDNSAKKFSSNGQYKITAIYSNNGNYIIKNLTYQHIHIRHNE
jgi:hypothetical protein